MSAKAKYEIIEIDSVEVTVDVSLLIKSDDLFFNATKVLDAFKQKELQNCIGDPRSPLKKESIKVKDWLKQKQTAEYIEALIDFKVEFKSTLDLVQPRRGKFGGTYLHKDLSLIFGRWISPRFAVQLDQWFIEKLKEEQSRKRSRLEARTGFLPMTDAILRLHDPAKFYHFSNEADLLNRIILGMSAKKFKAQQNVLSVRDGLTAAQLKEFTRLQTTNAGLIDIGMDYDERKGHLKRLHEDEMRLLEGRD